jgi:RNA polymerase sigma-70 factor (ECF subfamily)
MGVISAPYWFVLDRRSSTHDDRVLTSRILAGDEAAFAALVTRHTQSMLHVAQRFVSSRAAAEEVVQDTWLAVLRGLSSFEGRSTLALWIYRILTNHAKTRAIRDRRSIPFSSLAPHAAEDEAPSLETRETPEVLLARAEALSALDGAIARLPTRQRAVFLLRELEGVGPAETCELLDISEPNQRVLLHRARTSLRAALR